MDHASLRIAVAALALIAGTGAVLAQGADAGPRGPLSFEALDFDGSGEITTEDFAARRADRFASADSDGDGQISKDEFLAHAAEQARDRAARMFARLDADGDGVLSRDAIEARLGGDRAERMLRRADLDGSGGVDAEEFDAFRERLAERRGDRNGNGHRERR